MTENNSSKRPSFLTLLCVLTFIYSGFSIVGALSNITNGAPSSKEIRIQDAELSKSIRDLKKIEGSETAINLIKKFDKFNKLTTKNFWFFSISNLIISLLGVFAAQRMFTGFKIGFHLYIAYCLISLLIFYVVIPAQSIPTSLVIFSLIVSAIFIWMYSKNLSWMNKGENGIIE